MIKTDLETLKLKQLSNSIEKKQLIPVDKLDQRIRDIRKVLGMTQKQMAKRLKVSQPVFARMEDNIGSSSLKTIVRIAKALECEFMGIFISKQPLQIIIKKQAEKTAKKILNRTYANMAMEKQAPTKEAYKYQLKKLTEELISNPGPQLWEE